MKRIVALVDGFNLYHAIDDFCHRDHLKWVDLRSLIGAFVNPKEEQVIGIHFFTAFPPWDIAKRTRHEVLVDMYRELGITIEKGRFKERETRCNARCQERFIRYEEKETDINIALKMVEAGLSGACEKIFLLTGDSDQVPTIHFCRRRFPNMRIKVLVPPSREARGLMDAADEHARIGLQHLKKHRLADELTTASGRIISCPEKWQIRDGDCTGVIESIAR